MADDMKTISLMMVNELLALNATGATIEEKRVAVSKIDQMALLLKTRVNLDTVWK